MSTKYFDKAATDYDKKTRRIELADKISNAIMQLPITEQMNGIEYGCGTGLVGMSVAPFLDTLTAIDSSQGMLDMLQKKIQEQEITNVKTLCCDFSTESFTEKQDLIICSMTLHHLENAKDILLQFTTLLNPGGYLAIADCVTEDGSFHDSSDEGIWHHGFNPEELKTFLGDADMGSLQSSIVHTITKNTNRKKEYPVFLLTGQKNR